MFKSFLVLLMAYVSINSAVGLSRIPRPWQAEVFEAEFVGIIRCIKPGGDYEVVDAWKHVGGETVLKIHHAESYHRIGQEFLACLKPFSPADFPKSLVSWDGLQSPSKWRLLPDRKYTGQIIELSWLEKRRRTRQKEPVEWNRPYDYSFLVQMAESNKELKRQVQVFSSQSEEGQEYDLLLASLTMEYHHKGLKPKRPLEWPFRRKSVSRLMKWIFRYNVEESNGRMRSGKEVSKQAVYNPVLPRFYEGRFHTLKNLAGTPVDQFPFPFHFDHEIKFLTEKLSESERKEIRFYTLSKKAEFTALKSVIARNLKFFLNDLQRPTSQDPETLRKMTQFQEQVMGFHSLESLLEALIVMDHPRLINLLSYGGRETLAWLEANSAEMEWVHQKDQLRRRLGFPESKGEEDAEELQRREQEAERLLNQSQEIQQTISIEEHSRLPFAIHFLTLKKPAVVSKFLESFTDPIVRFGSPNSFQEQYWIQQSGYYYASFFGHLCPENRSKYLLPLLVAKDPFVQAAAAIYLSFDSSEASLSHLKGKTQLSGLPGAWAALALVRRGHSEYMPKALTLYQPYSSDLIPSWDPFSIGEQPKGARRTYKGPWPELESMLSQHIARLSEKYLIDPPTLPYPYAAIPRNEQSNEQRRLNYEAALGWWQNNKSVIQDTRDPLIDAWIAQRID